MLVCLEQGDYISPTGTDRYVLSLRLFQLVQEHPPTKRSIRRHDVGRFYI
jgi:hypothetical protein